MNFISRLILLMLVSISFTVPATAAVVASDIGGYCTVAADDDGEKEPEEEAEPDCD
ncbi:MAG: hypothetical protein PVG45_00630 [Gammaproteobacteria bacterium]|jgi:hypothetical protein